MHTGHRYPLTDTIRWSQREFLIPLILSLAVVVAHTNLGLTWIGVPWLPISMIGVAVAFYLGFKNNASYDRMWEARKIYGAIVNASRSWAFTARDFVTNLHADEKASDEELDRIRRELVLRHVAWMDALRFQLRKVKSWEHEGPQFDGFREFFKVAEYSEDLHVELARCLPEEEIAEVTAQINPAARLLSNQSRQLLDLRERGLIDDFRHMELQKVLHELMTQQGKAERIKNFPFPRQYSTVNSIFAMIFTTLVPFGMVQEFASLGEGAVWLTVPFSTVVCWVFLTTDKIGDWSESPFEGLANDVPITAMTRGIERDVRQMMDEKDLPPARSPENMILT